MNGRRLALLRVGLLSSNNTCCDTGLKNLFRSACADLEALRTVVLMADREDCLSVAGETLQVKARALIPIIAEIRKAIGSFKRNSERRGLMFSDCDLEFVKGSAYEVRQANHHDVTLHSALTGHDWVIVTNYASPDCYLLHRHSAGRPYHRQRGQYGSLIEALRYIDGHEKWAVSKKERCIMFPAVEP